MTKSSCAERTILVVRILVNTWNFETHVTVVRVFAPSAWICSQCADEDELVGLVEK